MPLTTRKISFNSVHAPPPHPRSIFSVKKIPAFSLYVLNQNHCPFTFWKIKYVRGTIRGVFFAQIS